MKPVAGLFALPLPWLPVGFLPPGLGLLPLGLEWLRGLSPPRPG